MANGDKRGIRGVQLLERRKLAWVRLANGDGGARRMDVVCGGINNLGSAGILFLFLLFQSPVLPTAKSKKPNGYF